MGAKTTISPGQPKIPTRRPKRQTRRRGAPLPHGAREQKQQYPPGSPKYRYDGVARRHCRRTPQRGHHHHRPLGRPGQRHSRIRMRGPLLAHKARGQKPSASGPYIRRATGGIVHHHPPRHHHEHGGFPGRSRCYCERDDSVSHRYSYRTPQRGHHHHHDHHHHYGAARLCPYHGHCYYDRPSD